MATLVETTISVRGPVDRQAPGSIADVLEVELPPGSLQSSWLSGIVGPACRSSSERVVAKFLKPRWLEEGHQDAIRSLATEARALSLLQRSFRVTPLLGMGSLDPGMAPQRGDLQARLSDSLEAFEAEVAEAAGSRRLPFVLLGNVPFEWTLLEPYVSRLFETGAEPELRLAEAVHVAIELLRFFDRARAEVGVYHFDMKLEHAAWHDGCLVVIDWNWSQVLEPGLNEAVLYQDLRRLFIRVLYPLLTGRDIDGNEPSAAWGRIGDPDLYPHAASELLPFPNVERLVDDGLRRWLSRGFERQGRAFPTHGAAADELQSWLIGAQQRQPLWPRLDLLASRCVELESQIQALSDEARRLREEARAAGQHVDPQFTAELARLTRGLARFRAARPLAITRTSPGRHGWTPWSTSARAGDAQSPDGMR
ncbi:MAG: hypothetical protein IT307_15190 [Chloroflexi bacterium]|nr:hypothetical protein [Chloroflexota bacterium]